MHLTYKTLSVDEHGIELSLLKNEGAEFFVFQGGQHNRRRLRRSFRSAMTFFGVAPDYFLKPVSFNDGEQLVTALYSHVSAGELQSFLSGSRDFMQYAIGKRAGRALLALHGVHLDQELRQRAQARQERCREKFTTYLTRMERIPDDGATVDAIGARFDSFSMYKPVMRYGGFKVSNLLLTSDLGVVFKPSATFGPGDVCEDLALAACENSGAYPCFVAGVIDGYFAHKVNPGFFMSFAMYCAINSLYRCSSRAARDAAEHERMLAQSRQIQADFQNFKTPVPSWYGHKRVKNARQLCQRKSL